jgi:hypothetical protein
MVFISKALDRLKRNCLQIIIDVAKKIMITVSLLTAQVHCLNSPQITQIILKSLLKIISISCLFILPCFVFSKIIPEKLHNL